MEQRIPSLQERQFAELKSVNGQLRPSGAQTTTGVGGLVRVEILNAQQLDMSLVTYLTRKKAEIISEAERTRFVKQVEFALALSQPIRVSAFVQKIGTAALAQVEGTTDVVSGVLQTRNFTLCCDEPCPAPPDKPLLLIKCADRPVGPAGRRGDVLLALQQPRRSAVDGRGGVGQSIIAVGIYTGKRSIGSRRRVHDGRERSGIAEIAMGDKRPAGGGTGRRLAIPGKDSLTNA